MFGTSRAVVSSKIKSVTVADSAITISDKVKSLGVILNKCFTFDSQVKATCKAIHYHARSLRYIRRSLSDTLPKSVASSSVARLDYCNSFLVGTSDENLQRLQIAQNAVARVVSRTRKHKHIRPVLCSLHWLLDEYRIKLKITVMTFTIRQFGEPAYLESLLHDKVSVRSLRSSDKSLLDVHRRWTETAKHSFSFAALQSETVFLYIFANSPLSLSAKVV